MTDSFIPKFETLLDIFDASTARFKDRPLFGEKRGDSWQWMTYGEFARDTAEVRGGLFGPVDDLELHLRVEPRVIAVRSLSRSEWSRAGSNRARVESLRDGLRKAGQLDEEFGISGD